MNVRTLSCALILLSVAACDKAEKAPAIEKQAAVPTEAVIATVGKSTFTESDIDREFKNLPERFQAMKENDALRANVLSGMMTRKALTDKATVMGVAENPVVRSQLEQAKASILIQALHKDYLKQQSTISKEDIKKYFEDNKQRFNKGEQLRTRHILVKDEKKAHDLLQKIKNGANFSQLAKENSIDPGTKNNGGELPAFGKGAMAPAFEQAAFALKNKDDLSAVVQTQFGFHIIQLIEKMPTQEVKLEDVSAQIKNEIGQKSFQEWVENIKSENVFSVTSERYKKLIKTPVAKEHLNKESTK